MQLDQNPGITPPTAPPENPVLPNQPEAPEPITPDENPPVTEPETPPFDPAPERSPIDPGIPELNPDPIPGQDPMIPMN
jgi:hypothetical protein